MIAPAPTSIHPALPAGAHAPLRTLLRSAGRPLRFLFTGGTAGATQLLLLQLLVAQHAAPLVANTMAFLLAAQVNFLLSSVVTWRDRRTSSPTVLATRWIAFHASIALTAVLNLAVFSVAVTVFPHLVSAGVGIAAASALNFLSGDRLVFRAGAPAT